MAAETPKNPTYLAGVTHFYFAPEIRSVLTLLYLGIFGYFSLYYIDSIFLAIRFLLYVVLGHTALQGVTHLFIGMLFVISLVCPFFISFYSIFVLPRIWKKQEWATYVKWLVTSLVIAGGICIIIISDSLSRSMARQDTMQSFIEDTGLSARI